MGCLSASGRGSELMLMLAGLEWYTMKEIKDYANDHFLWIQQLAFFPLGFPY